jgi:phosphatidylethanolamine-binding protein (PEBP) family uncharacterized protein
MRPSRKALIGALLLPALALAGCGTGASTPTTAKGTGKITQVSFTSHVIDPTPKSVPTIPARYTCDGQNTPPPLEWGPVPAGTGELLLFLLGTTPVPGTNNVSITVEWAMAGINPALHRLIPGQLPQGAHPGLTTNHTRSYSVCPKRGQQKQYVFNGLAILSKLLPSSGQSLANAHGNFGAVYKRA